MASPPSLCALDPAGLRSGCQGAPRGIRAAVGRSDGLAGLVLGVGDTRPAAVGISNFLSTECFVCSLVMKPFQIYLLNWIPREIPA